MAKNSYGCDPRRHDEQWDPPDVVCLSEVPLSQIWSLCSSIKRRQKEFEPYGLVFPRNWARSVGCNPVFYSNSSVRGKDWPSTMLDRAYEDCGTAGREAIAALSRFFEPTGKHDVTREFWWEREWRHLGNLEFESDHLVAILCAEERHAQLDRGERSNGKAIPLIDPRWGMEPMLLALSGVTSPWPFPSSETHPSAT